MTAIKIFIVKAQRWEYTKILTSIPGAGVPYLKCDLAISSKLISYSTACESWIVKCSQDVL
jgi:hypothetical protein